MGRPVREARKGTGGSGRRGRSGRFFVKSFGIMRAAYLARPERP